MLVIWGLSGGHREQQGPARRSPWTHSAGHARAGMHWPGTAGPTAEESGGEARKQGSREPSPCSTGRPRDQQTQT